MQTPEDRFYNPARINAWFAVSALLALAAGAAAILADHYDREWKGYQEAFHGLERARAEAAAAGGAAEGAIPPGAAAIRDRLLFAGGAAGGADLDDFGFEGALEASRTEADFAPGAALAAREYEERAEKLRTPELLAEKARIEALVKEAEDARFEAEQEQRTLQALVDEHRFSMDHAKALGHVHEAEEATRKWKETFQREAEAHARMDAHAARKQALAADLKALLGPVAAREARAGRLLEIAGVAGARRKIDSWIAKGLRDAPLLDFVAPVTKIAQTVHPDLTVDYNFAQVQRVDRCMTCHTGIDKVKVDPETGEVTPLFTAENTPEKVFRTHPRPELFVSSVSKHSVGQVGCTVCHDGQGWGLSFNDAYHTPDTPEKEAEWKEKHHWHRGESWTFPMLPLNHVEASCAKCHRDPAATRPADSFAKEIPMAPKWNRGQRLVEEKGCFGCHKLDGYAVPGLDKWLGEIPHADEKAAALATAARKTGPHLGRIASKWKSEGDAWKWIWNPQALRPTTSMPRFFGQPNNSGSDPLTGVDYDLRTRTEVWGITAYLWDASEPWERPTPRIEGNAENGKALFGSAESGVGCLACHSVKDFPRPEGGPGNGFGPDLSTVGSKVGRDWLFHWLRNPSDYWHGTRMPSLRLTVAEAADLAAYLETLKDEAWEKDQPPPPVEGMVRDLAIEAARLLPEAGGDPSAFVERLSPRDRLKVVGKRAITKYSCFGCHEIRGFEKADRIGTQLGGNEGWGSKDVDRLDFGLMKDPAAVATYAEKWGARLLPHRKPEWANLKLLNPRVFDAGVTKQPHEKLLMPNFHFTEDEADAVVTYLMSLQVGEVAPKRRPIRGPEDVAAERMRWVARQYNCYGCHTMAQERVVLPDQTRETRPRGGDIRPWILDEDGYENRDAWPPTLGGESSLVPAARDRVAEERGIRLAELAKPPAERSKHERVRHPHPRDVAEVGEGFKVQASWLFRFLRDPGEMGLRYWLKVRMPTFPYSEAELNALVHGFAAADRVPFPFEFGEAKAAPLSDGEKEEAKAFFQSLECAKCHPTKGGVQEGPPPSAFAPDLNLTFDRLRPDWVRLWLRNPGAVQKGTKMPAFWAWDPEKGALLSPTPEDAPRRFYGDDAEKQMEALVRYVFDLGRPKAPAGGGTK